MNRTKFLIIAAISLFTFNANAEIVETGTCNQAKTCKYEIDNEGNLTISGKGKIDNNAFSSRSDIKTVIIKNGITEIGKAAFFDNSNLESLDVAKTVTKIGADVTTYCRALNDVTIRGENVEFDNYDSFGYAQSIFRKNFNVIPGSETEQRMKDFIAADIWCDSRCYKFSAYIPIKRTHYTIPEAKQHVEKGDNNTITFTFK